MARPPQRVQGLSPPTPTNPVGAGAPRPPGMVRRIAGGALPVAGIGAALYTLLGGGSDQETQEAGNDRLAQGLPDAAPQGREVDEQLTQFFKSRGYDDAWIEEWKRLPPDAQTKTFQTILNRNPSQGSRSSQPPIPEGAEKLLPPHVQDMWPYLPDQVKRKALQDQLDRRIKDPTGVGYNSREGKPKLKIVQDEAFRNSGLKSGQVVCIRIP